MFISKKYRKSYIFTFSECMYISVPHVHFHPKQIKFIKKEQILIIFGNTLFFKFFKEGSNKKGKRLCEFVFYLNTSYRASSTTTYILELFYMDHPIYLPLGIPPTKP